MIFLVITILTIVGAAMVAPLIGLAEGKTLGEWWRS